MQDNCLAATMAVSGSDRSGRRPSPQPYVISRTLRANFLAIGREGIRHPARKRFAAMESGVRSDYLLREHLSNGKNTYLKHFVSTATAFI